MARAPLVEPHFFIWWEGERWVEVEWAADGRYDIGYQLAHPVHKEGQADYMGLFENTQRRRVTHLDSQSSTAAVPKEKR